MPRARKDKKSDQMANEEVVSETLALDNKKDQIRLKFENKMVALKLKFKHIKQYFDRFANDREIPLCEVEVRLRTLKDLQGKFDELFDEVLTYSKEPYIFSLSEEFEEFSNVLYSLVGKSEQLLKDTRSAEAKSCTANKNVFIPKLPEIKIQNFNGDHSQWLAFKETFETVIHKNSEISDIIKFTYLLDKIKGDAKACVGHVVFTSEGNQKSWKTLCEKYDDKRAIIEVHINGILSVPRISKDNYEELNELINSCTAHISSLEVSGYAMDKLSEQLIINIVLNKISANLKMEWEKQIPNNHIPNWQEFLEFLHLQSRILRKRMSETSLSKKIVKNHAQSSFKSKENSSSTFLSNETNRMNNKSKWPKQIGRSSSRKSCPICKDDHLIFHCSAFLEMDTHSRYAKIKELGLCINCITASDHMMKDCKYGSCKHCNKKHNSLLHHFQQESPIVAEQIPASAATGNTSYQVSNDLKNFHIKSKSCSKHVILSTAMVLAKDKSGKFHNCRILLDSASTTNYITKSFANKLKLDCTSNQMSSMGLNKTITQITEKVNAQINSRVSKYKTEIECYVGETISDSLPQSTFDISYWHIPNGMVLADPQFYLSRPIDMLIGAEKFYDMLLEGKFVLGKDLPQFQQFVFGWVCVGILLENRQINFHSVNKNQNISDSKLHQSLKEFFDIDQVPEKKILSKEELFCETHFSQTFARDNEGRYIVSLPLKPEIVKLGESKQCALNRFRYLERKFKSNPSFKKEYSAVINDYIDQGHMKLVNSASEHLSNGTQFYLPHHAVIKRSSTTTQVRIVFDASAKSSSGVSLNDVMCVGPTVQNTSYNIILRFRRHKFVITADISQMYRQVKINSQQIPLQRILWRENVEEPIRTYELTRVTFGTAAAPYLATRSLQQLAMDEKQSFLGISEIIQKDVYVDDILTGSNNIEKMIEIQQQLMTSLQLGGFKLHKWCSNAEQVLNNIPNSYRERLKLGTGSSDECLKTLGLIWIPKLDVFKFNVPIMKNQSTTKRKVLSDIAKLYDPLGLLAPIMVKAKIFLQTLWKTNIDWDDTLSDEMIQYWNEYCNQLADINNIKLDRRITTDNNHIIQLHGYSDASEKGYGACLYVRSIDSDMNSTVKLVCSKSRVAPIKFVSLPRLELCAALVLSRLVHNVVNTLEIPFDEVYLWSDSTIVLTWIQTPAHTLKTFVANRVNEIQDLTNSYNWNHIKSSENPADIISRGVMPSDLINLDTWWKGPRITKEVNFKSDLSKFVIQYTEDNTFECKKEQVTLISHTEETALYIIEKYSAYYRLLRIIAYCRRFINNSQPSNPRLSGNLSVNFISTKNELGRWYRHLHTDIEIQTYYTSQQINWNFIPPRSPNFGGLWESGVKSFKHHLKRIASNTCFSYEELHTVVTQIECILNSRPLTTLSTDPNDPLPLTPGHFLTGGPIVVPIEPVLTNVSHNRLSNWNKVAQTVQHFWKRYSLEYIHLLQQRTKWKNKTPDMKINDIVLVCDDALPTASWMMGIVLKTHVSKDKHVRVVTIKTKNGEFKRSINKLCKLPLD